MTSRLLITGAGGFLGARLCKFAVVPVHAVMGRSKSHSGVVEALGIASAATGELSNFEFVLDQLAQVGPTVIIHAAALAHPAQCEQDPELSLLSNVRSAQNLARACAQSANPPRLIFVSSEQVFSGKSRRAYTLTDAPDPINVYGQHKALAEQQLRAIYPSTSIVRLPLMYGSIPEQCTKINHQNNSDPFFWGGMGFVGAVVKGVLAGQSVTAFADEFRPPAHVDDVAQGLIRLASLGNDTVQRLPKLLHLGGPQVLSRLQMTQMIVEALQDMGANASAAQIESSTRLHAGLAQQRPEYLDLDSVQSWSVLGLEPRTFANGLRSVSSSI